MRETRLLIVIPHYNRYPLIKETVSSIVKQTSENWKCVIVDDCSDYKQYNGLLGLVKDDSRFKLIRNESRRGAPYCRNLGASVSSSEYILFMDSDDIMAPWLVEERTKCISSSNDIDVFIYDSVIFETELFDKLIRWNAPNDENDLMRMLRADSIAHTSSVVWKRNFFELIGGWDPCAKCWQDWEILTRALIYGAKIIRYEVDPDTYIRRDEADRISDHEDTDQMALSRLSTFGKIHNMLIERSYGRMYLKNLEMLYVREYLSIVDGCGDYRLREAYFRNNAMSKISNRTRICIVLQAVLTKYILRRCFSNRRIVRYRIPCVDRRIPRNTFARLRMSEREYASLVMKWNRYMDIENGVANLIR